MLGTQLGSKIQLASKIRRSYYNMSYIQPPGAAKHKNVTLIPGKYIGPEVTQSVVDIFEAAMCPVSWDIIDNFDFSSWKHREALRKNKCIL